MDMKNLFLISDGEVLIRESSPIKDLLETPRPDEPARRNIESPAHLTTVKADDGMRLAKLFPGALKSAGNAEERPATETAAPILL